MRRFARSKWARAAVALCMGLAVSLAASARAGDRTEPPPPPGMYRLIRIGPQALVLEDEHGAVTMADEAPPRVKGEAVLGVFFGMAVGAVAGEYLNGTDDFVRGAVIGAGSDAIRGAVIGGGSGASAGEDAAPLPRPRSNTARPDGARYDVARAASIGAAPR